MLYYEHILNRAFHWQTGQRFDMKYWNEQKFWHLYLLLNKWKINYKLTSVLLQAFKSTPWKQNMRREPFITFGGDRLLTGWNLSFWHWSSTCRSVTFDELFSSIFPQFYITILWHESLILSTLDNLRSAYLYLVGFCHDYLADIKFPIKIKIIIVPHETDYVSDKSFIIRFSVRRSLKDLFSLDIPRSNTKLLLTLRILFNFKRRQ